MFAIDRTSLGYIAVPFVIFVILIADVTTRLSSAEKVALEQFERGFEVDASRREGIRDMLGRDVQTAVQFALHGLSELDAMDTNEARRAWLESSFEQLGFALKNSRYDFVEAFLIERTPGGDLLAHGRYPTALASENVDVSDSLLLAHIDLDTAELFRMDNALYQVEADSLLRISNTQPVLINSRLIAKGDEKFSSWFVSIRVGLADLHRSFDLIGQQMAGGVTPMRIINIDARSGDCQLVWDTGEGSIACDQATLGNALNYEVTYPSRGIDEFTYSLYQPSDAYRAYRAAGAATSNVWRSLVPVFLAFILLLTTLNYVRYRLKSQSLMNSFMRSLSEKDSINESIHEVLSSHLDMLSRFTYAIRQKDMHESERRYFDIAISEFMEANLSLNTLMLERTASEHALASRERSFYLKDLIEFAQMALEVTSVDTPIETRFLVSDDVLQDTRQAPSSAFTAVLAAISLSVQGTEEGQVEVTLWLEGEDESDSGLYLRIQDSGVGWGDLNYSETSTQSAGDNTSLKALIACLKFSAVTVTSRSETDIGNDYTLRIAIRVG
ncbi:MAG: hypothetical protein DBW89_02045 [Halieaceae bacterium]|nr:MAG: hypothetical protein DBW89_02045 [Halieaceae bacterium]